MGIRWIGATKEEETCIRELLSERKEIRDAVQVTLVQEEPEPEAGKERLHRVRLSGGPEAFTVAYSSRAALSRGIGLLLEALALGGPVDREETLSVERLLPMIDCSRNAVPKPETVERFIRCTALLGFNALMLYTEDTYFVPEEPYFGHLRGRYSKEEIRRIDRYAALFGMELIPCIQTLAHLDAIFKWPEYAARKDWDNILNLAEEKNYELIRRMIASVSDCFSSRRIHIGMDEAYLIGRGKYLEAKGAYEPSSAIMKAHLQKVLSICREQGFQAEIWSDMFFRMCTKSHTYYDPDCVITDEAKAAVPKDVTLVYWDYYSVDAARYERMFRQHGELTGRIAFAGGASNWYGLVPMTRFALNASKTALAVVKKHAVREVIVTLWNDDGAACPLFASLPALASYAEGLWRGDVSDGRIAEVLKALYGADLKAFLALETLEDLPGRSSLGKRPLNPTKYLFYQDLLQGKYEAHVPEGASRHFGQCLSDLKRFASSGAFGPFAYVGDTMAAFADVLAKKAELGKEIRSRYGRSKTEGAETLQPVIEEKIPELLEALDRFSAAFERGWLTENKPFGFEVLEIRISGVSARVKHALRVLNAYRDGLAERIPELEEPVLPVKEPAEGDGVLIMENRWSNVVTASILK